MRASWSAGDRCGCLAHYGALLPFPQVRAAMDHPFFAPMQMRAPFQLAQRPVDELEMAQWRSAMQLRYEVDFQPFLRLVGQEGR